MELWLDFVVVTSDPSDVNVPLSHLEPQEKAKRAGSFGQVASHYERYRPGPPAVAADWLLPTPVGTVVDLGAGTGSLTRLLVHRAETVIAVEPDERMRSVLTREIPGVRAVMGRGESMPIPDGSVDAVLASSSWHWMDPVLTLHEVARVLVPGGTLGALWSGPDPDGAFLVQAQAVLAERSRSGADGAVTAAGGDGGDGELAGLIMGDALRPMSRLEIPPGVPFDQPEHQAFTWNVVLNADDLIGLLGTLSWMITMAEAKRQRVLAEARRLLRELLGVEGETTVDVAFRSDAWRSRRHD
jgi:SAM-dependent methyltransferase